MTLLFPARTRRQLNRKVLLYDESLLLEPVQGRDELPEVAVEPPPELGEAGLLLFQEDVVDPLLQIV